MDNKKRGTNQVRGRMARFVSCVASKFDFVTKPGETKMYGASYQAWKSDPPNICLMFILNIHDFRCIVPWSYW